MLFVVGSLPLIWVGAWLKFTFVRNRWFRLTHLAAILVVVGESLAGVTCPLTAWENAARQIETDQGFIQLWLHRILFYTFPEGILTTVYVLFAGLVAITFKWIPPDYRNTRL